MPRRSATNRIQNALDVLGVDWHSPRYGRTRIAGDATTIHIADNGAFGPLTIPLHADGRPHLDARQPPAVMNAVSWAKAPFWRNPAYANLMRVNDIISSLLGQGERLSDAGIEMLRWHDQAGSIVLSCALSGSTEEDARLREGCRIRIVPGWRRPLSESELASISDMGVVGRGSVRGVRVLTTTPALDEDAAYVREPGPDPRVLDAIIGVDAGRATLIACPGRLLVIPVPSISGLRHESYEPGSSPGRSALYAVLDSGGEIMIADHDETHGLELVARGLSRALSLDISRLDAVAS